MLMLQSVRESDTGQETNERIRIVRNYTAASGLEYEWREAPDGPAEPGNGILRAYLGGLSGAIYVEARMRYLEIRLRGVDNKG